MAPLWGAGSGSARAPPGGCAAQVPRWKVRLATLDDAEPIRQIYNLEVTTSTATFDLVPRSLEEQRTWLSERSGARAVLVAEADGEVCGFGSLSPWRDRPAVRLAQVADATRSAEGVCAATGAQRAATAASAPRANGRAMGGRSPENPGGAARCLRAPRRAARHRAPRVPTSIGAWPRGLRGRWYRRPAPSRTGRQTRRRRRWARSARPAGRHAARSPARREALHAWG